MGRRKRKATAKLLLEEQRGLAAALAVITQVGIARTRYESLREECLTADQGAHIQADILKHIEALFKAGSASRQSVVKERLSSLVTDIRRDLLQAELKDAVTHIYASIGSDLYGADIRGDEDVVTIAASLQAHWNRREVLPRI